MKIVLKSLTSWKGDEIKQIYRDRRAEDALDEAEDDEAAEEEEDDELEEEDEVVRAAEANQNRLLHPIGEQAGNRKGEVR
jgi:hypothetical protein